ncbi:GNAT family N-acetyltransferase [Agromyces endophyticus]|uniref:GNAT family N-acetyltransferase n=1 Tax=Agromyces sp. H17E-10 TaxID=2932244 RepID=UPI001FD1900C|nr:GNAT family N-acetyltransferase [Agromyces sp. H17E-10]UOQ88491.1 GNAT family N-acetyltransferase [Agromyces sp. H17E-10]
MTNDNAASAPDRPNIRPIRSAEFGQEAAVIARAFAAGPYGHLPKSAERAAFEADSAGRAADGGVLVAVGADGVVRGTTSVLRAGTRYSRVARPGEAEVRLISVDPAAQGAGLGAALTRASLEVALEWGASALVLDTGARNTRAQALYERSGFERDGERDATVGADVDSLVYSFTLQQRDDLVIRSMRADEADEVAALVEHAYAADFELNAGYRADIVAVAERARDHQVWVAVDTATGELLGTASTPRAGATMSAVARAGELDFRFLGVAPAARGRGVGEALVRNVLLLARIRGLDRVVLNTGPDMLAAQRLYDRLGFSRLHDREFRFERPDGSGFQMLAYGRDAA